MTHSPHANDDIVKLRDQFKGTLKFLNNTRLEDKRNLSALPWLILLGPSASGKTSLLAYSEQDFVLAKRTHRLNLQAIKPTKLCDWWATKTTIYADLSGQFSKFSEKQTALWQETVQLFAEYAQLNSHVGVLVVISIPELMQQRDYLLTIANAIQQQLHDLRQGFNHDFPVYLVVNKLDILTGFTDFFYDLSREERAQTWGFSCTDKLVDEQFDTLVAKLNEQLVFRLQQQSQLAKRVHIHELPQEMANLKPKLLDFMEQAIPTNLRWQSIHFASATTQPNTYSKAIVRKKADDVTQAAPPKAYFVEQLFNQFTQRQLQQQTRIKQRHKRWSTLAIYVAAGLTLTLGVGAWTYEFSRQLSAIHQTEKVLATYQVLVQAKQFKALGETIVLLDTLKQASALHHNWFTANKVKQLQVSAEKTYQLALQNLLMPHMIGLLVEPLKQPLKLAPHWLYANLQAYLMLADKAHWQPEFLTPAVIANWQASHDYQDKLLSNLHHHLTALFKLQLPAVQLQQPLVAAARLRLNSLAAPERAYVILHNQRWYPELTLLKNQQAHVGISSLYTKQALVHIYQNDLTLATQQALAGNWVLGSLDPASDAAAVEVLKAQLSDLYLADYARFWQGVVAQLTALPLTHPEQLTDLLDQLLNTQSVINKALQRINDNTQVSGLTKGYSTAIADKLAEKFAGFRDVLSGKERWQTLQIKVRQFEIYLLQMKLGNDDNEAAYTAAKIRILAPNAASPIIELREFANQLPNPWQSWLQQVAANSWHVILDQAYHYLNQLWQQQVIAGYQQTIANHYPFNKDASTALSLEEFNRFFSPNGILNTFFVSYLQPLLDTTKTNWQLKMADKQTLAIKASTLQALQQAAIIQRMFYPEQQGQPHVMFNLSSLAVDMRISGITLSIDGKTLTYPGSTAGSQFVWPQGNGEVKLNYHDQLGDHELLHLTGPWALFEFLDQVTLIPTSDPRHYMLALNADGYMLQFDLNAQELVNPFAKEILTSFKLPDQL